MASVPTGGDNPRIALIGCGRWGRNIARVLSRLGSLAVIVDPEAENLANYALELGTTVTTDIERAFAADIQGVAIAAPAVDHARLVRRALAACKPVFVEKPLALDIVDAEACADEARQRGVPLMVGHLLQFHPAFVQLKAMVGGGVLGQLRHVTSNRLNPGAIRTEENALWSMAPHDFSMILSLVGTQPLKVAALPVNIVTAGIPDQFHVQAVFPNDVTAHVSVSWLSPFKEHKLVALGTEGALVFEDTVADPARKLVHYPAYVDRGAGAPRFVKTAGEPVAYPAGEPLEMEMRAFLDSVSTGRVQITGPDEAIPVLRLLREAQRAADAFIAG